MITPCGYATATNTCTQARYINFIGVRLRQQLKNLFLPTGRRDRKILFGPAAGAVMSLDLHDEFRIWLGVYEAELNAYFRRLIYPGALCFDVGAAEGYNAVMMAKLSGREVISFEPGAAWLEKVRSELSKNDLAGQVIEAFVGEEVGDGKTTIDAAAETYGMPDFIKMDIEGAETSALRGAHVALSTRKPNLIIEVHGVDAEDECIDILQKHGYRPERITPRKLFPEYRPIDHNQWLVCAGEPTDWFSSRE